MTHREPAKRYVVTLAAFATLAAGCAHRQPWSPAPSDRFKAWCGLVTEVAPAPPRQFESVVVSTSACEGTCPEYALRVDRSGAATFCGYVNAPALGCWRRSLSPSEVDRVGLELSALAEPHPPPVIEDMPSISIRVEANGAAWCQTILRDQVLWGGPDAAFEATLMHLFDETGATGFLHESRSP